MAASFMLVARGPGGPTRARPSGALDPAAPAPVVEPSMTDPRTGERADYPSVSTLADSADPLPVPTLDDGFVRLRPPTEADADDITAACQLPEVVAGTLVPHPYERAHAEEFIARHTANGWGAPAARRPDGSWDPAAGGVRQAVLVITVPSLFGDRWLANIGLHDIDLGLGQAEVGYLSGHAGRGRGAVTRALILVSRWAMRDLGLRRVYWYAIEGNHASRAVAERAGFTIEGTARLGLEQRGVLVNGWTGSLIETDVVAPEPIAEIAAGPWHLLPTARPAAARCAWTVHRSVGGEIVGTVRVYDGQDGRVLVTADESVTEVGAQDAVGAVRRYIASALGWVIEPGS